MKAYHSSDGVFVSYFLRRSFLDASWLASPRINLSLVSSPFIKYTEVRTSIIHDFERRLLKRALQ